MSTALLLLFACRDGPKDEPSPRDSAPDTGAPDTGAPDTSPSDTARETATDTDTATDTGTPMDTAPDGDTGTDTDSDTHSEDTAVPADTAPLADAAALLFGEVEADGAGAGVAGAGDLDADGLDDVAVLATERGLVYVAHAPFAGAVQLADAAAVLGLGDPTDYEYALAGGADLTGDGLPDVLIGRKSASIYGPVGDAVVFAGPLSGALDVSAAITLQGETTHYYVEIGDYEYGYAGSAVATGDVDGDGAPDAVVTDTAVYGTVYAALGPITGPLDLEDQPSVAATSRGSGIYEGVGTGVALADVDGDGLDDVFVLGPGDADEGVVFLALGPPSDWTDLDDAAGIVRGDASHALEALAAGDLDGDGRADLAVGCPRDDDGGADAGSVHVFPGPLAGEFALVHATASFVGAEDDHAGFTVAAAGDLHGDGTADLLIGGTEPTPVWATAGSVWLAPVAAGTFDLVTVPSVRGTRNQQAGYAVAVAGDVDGDALDDLLVGGPGDDTNAIDAGVTWVLSGADLP